MSHRRPLGLPQPVLKAGTRVRMGRRRGVVTWYFPASMAPTMATYTVKMRGRVHGIVFLASEVRAT